MRINSHDHGTSVLHNSNYIHTALKCPTCDFMMAVCDFKVPWVYAKQIICSVCYSYGAQMKKDE